jgi:hypothetical protein
MERNDGYSLRREAPPSVLSVSGKFTTTWLHNVSRQQNIQPDQKLIVVKRSIGQKCVQVNITDGRPTF